VEVNHFRYGQPNDWATGIAQFEGAMRSRVPSDILDVMVPKFTTSNPNTDMTLLIAFLDAASSFYGYSMMTLCGFPSIRIEGTVEDWTSILTRIARIKELIPVLADYCDTITPIVEQIAFTVSCKPEEVPTAFWKSMYKVNGGSGGPYINGWLTSFVAYVCGRKDKGMTLRSKEDLDWTVGGSFRGLHTYNFPSHISTVPFVWNYLGAEIPMSWQAGIIGCEVRDGHYTPVLGFRVVELNAR
jgi:hypothetical protein